MEQPKDFLVQCNNPESFDRTIQAFGAVLMDGGVKGKYIQKDGLYTMRVFNDPNFVKFAIEQQGYGKVISEVK